MDKQIEYNADSAPCRPAETIPQFKLAPALQPCSFNTCEAGHRYPAKLAIAECPGCKAHVLAILMEQCPVCNEPTAVTQLRTDHVMQGGGMAAQCAGQRNNAEVTAVTLRREHAAQTQLANANSVNEHIRKTAQPAPKDNFCSTSTK